jgi:hypothetical protein
MQARGVGAKGTSWLPIPRLLKPYTSFTTDEMPACLTLAVDVLNSRDSSTSVFSLYINVDEISDFAEDGLGKKAAKLGGVQRDIRAQ